MNWKQLLRSKKGLTQGAKFLLTTVGVGALATYTLSGAADKQIEQEKALRALSSATSSSPYAGLQWGEEGPSSINIKDGLGQVATRRDREALERNSPYSNNFGLDAAQNLNSYDIGQAAQFDGASEGLSMGGDKGSESSVRFANTAPDTAGGMEGAFNALGAGGGAANAGSDGGSLSGGNGAVNGARAGPQLGQASMARASGSASASTFNPANPSGNAASGTKGNSKAAPKGYEMSGAMPDGSASLVDSGARNGNHSSSSFGRGRDLHAGKAKTYGQAKSDLEDIATKSAAAAQNEARSANEGSRAFLSGQTGSSGLGEDSTASTGGASSSDFSNNKGAFKAPNTKVNKSAIDNSTKWMKQRDKAMDALQKKFTRNLLLSIAIIMGASFALSALYTSRFTWPMGLAYWVLAAVCLAAVTLLSVDVIKSAAQVMSDFANPPKGVKPNNTGMKIMQWTSGGLIGLMAATIVWPTSIKKGVMWLLKNIFYALPMNVVSSLFNLGRGEIGQRYK